MKKPSINAQQRRFVDEYLIDLNATQAATRAGYSAKTANEQGARLLANVSVQQAIQAAIAERAKRTQITQDAVLKKWWSIASANPNDIIKFRRVNCRYCWGEDHYYQWAAADYYNAQTKANAEGKTSPDCDGGFGFDKTRPPHPDCPECRGEGRGDVFISDTDRLTGDAALLYAGAKEGKFGLEIKLHDQAAALVNVARHLGMFDDKLTLKGDADNPLHIVAALTPKEKATKLAQLLAVARARADKDGGT
jgi:phage terminase small subunit